MPHFDVHGQGTWICQFCHGVFSDSVRSVWVTGWGNKCPNCAGIGHARPAQLPSYGREDRAQ